MELIFHITAATAWDEALAAGLYSADTLGNEGFIHFSTRTQVLKVAARFYRGQPELLLVVVDPQLLTAELRFEESEPGQWFPHLYGPLNLDAVVATYPFPPESDGSFRLPQAIAA